MNKYETKSFVSSKEEWAAKSELEQVFKQFREIVLNNKDYSLGAAKELLETLGERDSKKIFEMFNYQEGSLPDNLGAEYIKLVYSPESFESKMSEGKTFYEALSAIAWEIKNAHIDLNSDLVQAQIKLSAERLKIAA